MEGKTQQAAAAASATSEKPVRRLQRTATLCGDSSSGVTRGRAAVLGSVGGSVAAIKAATFEIIIDLEGLRPDPGLRPLCKG